MFVGNDGRSSGRPSVIASALSFIRGSTYDRRISNLDKSMSEQQAADPEEGVELDSFGKPLGRRSSSMVETDLKDAEPAQGIELFDLGEYQNCYDYFCILSL